MLLKKLKKKKYKRPDETHFKKKKNWEKHYNGSLCRFAIEQIPDISMIPPGGTVSTDEAKGPRRPNKDQTSHRNL